MQCPEQKHDEFSTEVYKGEPGFLLTRDLYGVMLQATTILQTSQQSADLASTSAAIAWCSHSQCGRAAKPWNSATLDEYERDQTMRHRYNVKQWWVNANLQATSEWASPAFGMCVTYFAQSRHCPDAKNLNQLIQHTSETRSLTHLAVVDGFEKNVSGLRGYRIGIDARFAFQTHTEPLHILTKSSDNRVASGSFMRNLDAKERTPSFASSSFD